MKNVIVRLADEYRNRPRNASGLKPSSGANHRPVAPANFGTTVESMFDVDSLVEEVLLHVPHSRDEIRPPRGRPENPEASDDFIACYQPYFHFGPDWGIYFDLERMVDFVRKFSFGDDSALVKKVLHHERFHFLVEYFGALREDASQGLVGNDVYKSYEMHNPSSPYRIVEEAMANAYALTRTYRKSASLAQYSRLNLSEGQIVQELKSICDQAPVGYMDYPKVMDPVLLFGWSGRSGRGEEKECFNNSVSIFFDAMPHHRGMSFQQFQNPLGGPLIHSQMLLLSPHLLQRVPMYVCYPAYYGAGSKTFIKFVAPNARLSEFYRFLEARHGVIYQEGRKHAKLRLPTGGKLNGWSRRGSKVDVRRYQIVQAARWLSVPAEKLADEFARWL